MCNDLAKDGWRLVSTAAANAGADSVFVWLFVERGISAEDIARAARQFPSTATR